MQPLLIGGMCNYIAAGSELQDSVLLLSCHSSLATCTTDNPLSLTNKVSPTLSVIILHAFMGPHMLPVVARPNRIPY